MFFDKPYDAFANMRRFLRPGGRLIFACWGPMPENPWVQEAMGVLSRHKELPKPVPRAPGPFAFAEADYVRDILAKAGFSGIEFNAWRGWQLVGGAGADARKAAQFLMDAAFVGDALSGEPQALKDRVLADLVVLFAKYDGPEGVRTPAMAWLVSARA
jgi:SAM-dependent methyltransferase